MKLLGSKTLLARDFLINTCHQMQENVEEGCFTGSVSRAHISWPQDCEFKTHTGVEPTSEKIVEEMYASTCLLLEKQVKVPVSIIVSWLSRDGSGVMCLWDSPLLNSSWLHRCASVAYCIVL